MKSSYLTTMFFFSILLLFSYDYGQVDAVSQATKGWPWPPYGYTYQVTVVPGIEGYVIVYDDTLYRGGTPEPEGIGQLKNFGIKTVITINPGLELAKKVQAAGLNWVVFNWQNKDIMSAEDLAQFLKLVKENKAPFYLHSKEENQNTGILAAIYRIHVQNWPYEKTIIEYGRVGGSLKDDDRLLRAIKKKE
ncbi:MAG TPA: hypothetical protein VK186_10340 [Candidatus Deferrimicrobium sp.]|nr:hypothetical protein [Candidatus Deferrimicrobium sp.]